MTARPSIPVALAVVKLGRAIAVEYHKPNGKAYRHEFKGTGPTLARTREGDALIVSPVRAGEWIEDAKPTRTKRRKAGK